MAVAALRYKETKPMSPPRRKIDVPLATANTATALPPAVELLVEPTKSYIAPPEEKTALILALGHLNATMHHLATLIEAQTQVLKDIQHELRRRVK